MLIAVAEYCLLVALGCVSVLLVLRYGGAPLKRSQIWLNLRATDFIILAVVLAGAILGAIAVLQAIASHWGKRP